ncbi:hypothetical protein MLD38_034403 [Melastoma candidum]|uniref:Uncharacterized protein n=1 Tax=Melastoma candidum TaxID=119954 RepID=A0ACB9MAD8_9MYRT|nr:hypothetical protein MLD38_034403 [Melastoma candidum]
MHQNLIPEEVKSKENLQCEKQVEEAHGKNVDKNKEMEREMESYGKSEARERGLEKAFPEKLAAGDKDYKPRKKSNETQHRSIGSSSNLRRPRVSRKLEPIVPRSPREMMVNQLRDGRLGWRYIKEQQNVRQRRSDRRTNVTFLLRCSSGKQGNLCALLSTLQYILGPDSSWQLVTLTEIVTAAAVRKLAGKPLCLFILTNYGKGAPACSRSISARCME